MPNRKELLASLTPEAYGQFLEDLTRENGEKASFASDPAAAEASATPPPPSPKPQVPRAPAVVDDAGEDDADQGDDGLVKKYLGKKYGFTGDLSDDAMKDAQKLAMDRRFNAQLGSAFQTIAGAADPHHKVDHSFYDNLEAGADQPAKDIASRRHGLVENQAFSDKQMADDPDSPLSHATRKGYASVLRQSGLPTDIIDGMSASQIHSFIEKPIDTMSKLQERRESARLRAEIAKGNLNFRDSQLDQRNAFKAHQANLRSLKGDKQLGQLVQNYNNLDNALVTLDKSGKVPPQALEDLQSIVISNMGVKGAGGVGERQARHIKNLGIKGSDLKQFLTGKVSDLGSDNDVVKYFRELAEFEKENIQHQAQARVAAATGGNDSVYARYPDYRQDLENAIGMQLGTMQGRSPGAPQAAAPRQAAGSAHPPGSFVTVRGKTYQVGDDGDTLHEVK